MSLGYLTLRFLREEADSYVRSRLLDAADRRTSGGEYFTFNAFNVNMDFDNQTVTVEDEFDADSEETTAMPDFLAALAADQEP
jgi:hypothetical protein